MKTKNIFRMLLVAAALLMGANNVKADKLWPLDAEKGNSTEISFAFGTFTESMKGKTLRITYSLEKYDWGPSYNITMRTNGSVTIFSQPISDDGSSVFDKVLDDDTFSKINTTDENNVNAVLVGSWVHFHKIEIVDGGSTEKATASISFSNNVELTFGQDFTPPTVTTTPANATVTYTTPNADVVFIGEDGSIVPVGEGTATITGSIAESANHTAASATYTIKVNKPTAPLGAVWSGAKWLNNFDVHPTLLTSLFSSAQSGGYIRFYGKVGPLRGNYWKFEIFKDWGDNGNLFRAEYSENNDLFANGYIDVPVDQINPSSISEIILNGCNLTITAIQVIAPDTPAKQDVTLTFSPSTATATMGEAFTAPTLTATANGETVTGLSISYSSSNTSVATVNASTGAVTLVAPGTTTITASFSGNDNYNAATASYTLTVNAAAEYVNVDDINIGENGYRTYVTWCAVDLSRSVNVEAYYATGLNSAGTEVEFTQVTGVCASGVPLLLKATVTGALEYKLLKSSATGTTPTDNKLQAGQGYEVSGDNKYVLTKHSGQVVFAEVNIVGALVPTDYAYLDLSGSNAARGRLTIRLKGESTGISNVETETIGDDVIYNLRGQRVEHPTKGLYIINGKKVVIK